MKTNDLIFGIFSSLGLERLSFDALRQLLSPFHVSAGTLRTNLSRMSDSGLIDVARHGKRASYSLRKKSKRIQEQVRFHFENLDWSRWDRRWFGFVFSISDQNKPLRHRVRSALTAHHFGCLYPGFWIRPHHDNDPGRELIADFESTGSGTAMQISFATELTEEKVAEIWNIDAVTLSYESLMDELRRSYDGIEKLTPAEAFQRSFLLGDKVIKQLFLDPQLPPELLPGSWQGNALRTLFAQWHQAIRKRREPFWRQIVGTKEETSREPAQCRSTL